MGLRKLVVIPVVALGFFVLAPAASAWMADLCISFGGYDIYQSGNTSCSTPSGRNLAVAVGAGSDAVVNEGYGNMVIALHDSDAAAGGTNNTSVAVLGSETGAGGTNNTVIALHDSEAGAGGTNNTVIALHDSEAGAGGTNNTSVAIVGSEAGAGGTNNTSVALLGSEASNGGTNNTSVAVLGSETGANGTNNTAIAKNGSMAFAELGTGNRALAAHDSYACAGSTESCQVSCSADVTAECAVTINPVIDPDNNTAVALNGGAAYAGGIGDFDWNKAVAIGACIAEAVWSTGDSEFCGPHHNDSPDDW